MRIPVSAIESIDGRLAILATVLQIPVTTIANGAAPIASSAAPIRIPTARLRCRGRDIEAERR
jgi:hypothetical protein